MQRNSFSWTSLSLDVETLSGLYPYYLCIRALHCIHEHKLGGRRQHDSRSSSTILIFAIETILTASNSEQKAKLLSFRYAIPLYYTICNVWTNDACASRSHHWFLNFSQQIKMHSVLFTSCVHLALAVPSNTLNVSNDLFEINGKKCQQWTHSWWKWRERKGANALTNEPNTTQHNTESQCLLLEWWDK